MHIREHTYTCDSETESNILLLDYTIILYKAVFWHAPGFTGGTLNSSVFSSDLLHLHREKPLTPLGSSQMGL